MGPGKPGWPSFCYLEQPVPSAIYLATPRTARADGRGGGVERNRGVHRHGDNKW